MDTLFALVTIVCVASASEVPCSEETCEGADPGVTTYFPCKGDCTKYVVCFNEVPTTFQCSEGLWFHPEISDCDYPGDYCAASAAPSDSTPPASPTPPIGPGPDPRCVDGNTAYWPHPVLCHRYIECHEGNSYEMQCPPGLYFSASLKECVNAVDSECYTSSDSTESPTDTTTPVSSPTSTDATEGSTVVETTTSLPTLSTDATEGSTVVETTTSLPTLSTDVTEGPTDNTTPELPPSSSESDLL